MARDLLSVVSMYRFFTVRGLPCRDRKARCALAVKIGAETTREEIEKKG
jgi:hypothetical protein